MPPIPGWIPDASNAILIGTISSAGAFLIFAQRNRSPIKPALTIGAIVSAATFVGFSYQRRRVALRDAALERLTENAKSLHLTDFNSLAPPVPVAEFDEATGQDAEKETRRLMKQVLKADKERTFLDRLLKRKINFDT